MTTSRLLGLIPARSGSRRVKDKNSREFGGSSLIELTISAALGARALDHVGFSTDSREYLKLAQGVGLDEQYLRPGFLADSESAVADCVLHYVEWAVKTGLAPATHIVLLQPTSPFRTSEDIDAAITVWKDSGNQSLVSVVRPAPRPELLIYRDKQSERLLRPHDQLTGEIFVLDGSIFISSIDQIRESGRFWNEESALYISDLPRYFDIDTELEFRAAHSLFTDDVFASR